MSVIQAILLGLIQGVAEFLPISSSGHLAIFKQVLHLDLDTGLLFDVLLHIGTLAAIFVAFWSDIRQLVVEGLCILRDVCRNIGRGITNIGKQKAQKKDYVPLAATPYRRFVLLILVATIPTGVLGIVLEDAIESAGAGLLVPGICLLVTGGLLLLADAVNGGNLTEGTMGFGKALFIGVAQGVATLPGLSRSGTTITAGLVCGLDRSFAVRYSFILSIPAVLGAAVLELRDFSPSDVVAEELFSYAVGMIVAAVVGYLCIRTMLVLVRGKKFRYFAVYCFVIGAVAVAAHIVQRIG